MRRIGTIFILVSFLIGIFIVPINATVVPSPSYSFAVQNNLLSDDLSSFWHSSNCSLSINSNDSLIISTNGDGSACIISLTPSPYNPSLNPGNYMFGFTADSSPNYIQISISVNGVSETLTTTTSKTFSLSSPGVAVVNIYIHGSQNSVAKDFSFRPFLIYDNNSVDSITGAFSSVIQAPFSAIASGFNSLSDQIIGVDNLITPFGTVLVFIVSIPLIVWGLNTLIGFITRPFKRR